MSIAALAPRLLRRKKGMVGLTLPPDALLLVDTLVGSFLGSTRSEVLRFVVLTWLTEHHDTVETIAKNSAPVRKRLSTQEARMDDDTRQQASEGNTLEDTSGRTEIEDGEVSTASNQADGHAQDEAPKSDAPAEHEAESER